MSDGGGLGAGASASSSAAPASTALVTARGSLAAGRRRRGERPTLSAEQAAEIDEAWKLFDADGCGSLDYHAAKVCMRALGFAVKKAEVKGIIADFDKAGDERLRYADYVSVLTDKYLARDPEAEMRKAFTLFDEDGCGRLTLKNVRRVARELGETISDEELTAMIGAAAAGGAGVGGAAGAGARAGSAAHATPRAAVAQRTAPASARQPHSLHTAPPRARPPSSPPRTRAVLTPAPRWHATADEFDGDGKGHLSEEDFMKVMRAGGAV